MILFESISYKNFFSTGQHFTKISLNSHNTSLFIGENGSGKSTICDALLFSLFGKAYRNINKTQIPNNINKKGCLTEVLFSKGSTKFKVIRGISPNIFEIYVNDKLLNQDAKSRDYQQYLEENILGFSYNTFSQVAILGSASFTPFLQLKPAERRVIVEDILDINIFSVMNDILKEKKVELSEELKINQYKLSTAKKSLENQEHYIKKMTEQNEDIIKDNEDKIHHITEENTQFSEEIVKLKTSIPSIPQEKLQAEKNKLNQLRTIEKDLMNSTRKIKHRIEYYNKNDSCTECKQKIDESFKTDSMNTLKTLLENKLNGIVETQNIIRKTEATLDDINATYTVVQKINEKITLCETKISANLKHKKSLETSNKKYQRLMAHNVDSEIEKLETLKKDIVTLKNELEELTDIQNLQKDAQVILKDTGIKAQVIKKFLPIINQTICKYLTQFGLNVRLKLDETFNSVISNFNSKDSLTYSSFSEGEKMRVTLSCLFALRNIAALKSSLHTNILIIDEIFDGALDDSGSEEFINVIQNLNKNTHCIIISHKTDAMLDKFNRTLKFNKKNHFSTVKQLT